MPEKIVLLLNDVGRHEGLISALVTSGRTYKWKQLHSNVSNWLSIVGIFETHHVLAVVGKMNGTTYRYLIDPAFREVQQDLFRRIAAVPNRIFIYEELLKGTGDPYGHYSQHFRDEADEFFDDGEKEDAKTAESIPNPILVEGNKILDKSGLEIFPYKKRAEVTNFRASLHRGNRGGVTLPSLCPFWKTLGE